MSELGEYRRLVEKPMIADYEAKIASLQDALQQLVDYVIDGCPEGSYIAVIEAKAALSNIRALSPASPRPEPAATPGPKPTEAMVLAGGEVLLDACSSDKGHLRPWKPFDTAQVAIKVWTAMAALAAAPQAQEPVAKCSHPQAKVWFYRDDDTFMRCPDCGSRWCKQHPPDSRPERS